MAYQQAASRTIDGTDCISYAQVSTSRGCCETKKNNANNGVPMPRKSHPLRAHLTEHTTASSECVLMHKALTVLSSWSVESEVHPSRVSMSVTPADVNITNAIAHSKTQQQHDVPIGPRGRPPRPWTYLGPSPGPPKNLPGAGGATGPRTSLGRPSCPPGPPLRPPPAPGIAPEWLKVVLLVTFATLALGCVPVDAT